MAYQIIIINSNNDKNTSMEVGGGNIARMQEVQLLLSAGILQREGEL